jgi:hypothetical protein
MLTDGVGKRLFRGFFPNYIHADETDYIELHYRFRDEERL